MHVLSLAVILSLVGCDKISALTQKSVDCTDPAAVDLVKTTFQKAVLNATKDSVQNSNNTDSANLRATINQITLLLDDIRTSKKDPQSTKNFCVGSLKATINADVISRANFVREHYSNKLVADDAFVQGIDFDANHTSYDIEYAVQPTDDGKKVFVELQNGTELASFLANVVIDASQKNDVQNQKSQQIKELAKAEATQKQQQQEAADAAAAATAIAQQEAQDSLAAISAEQEKIKAQLDFKRKEFNTLWKSASADAQSSLTDDQAEWVKKRDEICIEKAKAATPERQEIVRMQCVTKLLGERYYEVKKYFDNYKWKVTKNEK